MSECCVDNFPSKMQVHLLQNPLTLAIMPYIHFVALQKTKIPFVATLPLVALALAIPCFRDSDGVGCNPYLMAMFLGIALRMMDAATLSPPFDFKTYLDYFLAFKHPTKAKQSVDVPYEKQTISYYQSEIFRWLPKFFIYFGIIKYCRVYRPNWNPKPMVLVDWSDPWALLDTYLLGWALCMLMEVLVTIFIHFVSWIFKTPYVPIMNQPYLATSVRDFWSNRWNLIVQRGFKVALFEPTLRLLGHDSLQDRHIPHHHLAIAGMATFIFSSLMHEWTLFVMFDQSSTREQMCFFILHGLWTIGEVSVRKLCTKYLKIDLSLVIPKPIQILYTHAVLMISGPLFMNPYIRENLYFKVGFA
jgi:hypothetical protein